MPTFEEQFLEQLRAAFNAEAEDHLQAMAGGLLEVEKTSGADQQTQLVETIYREAHSLKGASRAVNRTDIEAICQAMETVFSAWKRHEISPSADAFDVFHRAVDVMRE